MELEKSELVKELNQIKSTLEQTRLGRQKLSEDFEIKLENMNQVLHKSENKFIQENKILKEEYEVKLGHIEADKVKLLKDLEETTSNLEQSRNERQSLLESFESKLSQMEQINKESADNLRNEKESRLESETEMKKEYERVLGQFKDAEIAIQSLNTNLNDEKLNAQRLKEEAIVKLNELSSANEEHRKSNETLNKTLNELKLNHENLITNLNSITNENNDLKQKISQLEFKLHKTISDSNERFSQYEIKIETLESDLVKERKQCKDLSNALKDYAGKNEELSGRLGKCDEILKLEIALLTRKYEDENLDLTDKTKAIKAEYDVVISRNQILEKEVITMQKEISELRSDLIQSQNDAENSINELRDSYKDKVNSLEERLHSVEAKQKRQLESIDLLNTENQTLKARSEKLNSETIEMKEFILKSDDLVNDLNAKLKARDLDAKNFASKAQSLETRNKEVNDELKSATDELKKSKLFINEYEKRLTKETTKSKEEITTMTAEKESLLKEIEKLKDESLISYQKSLELKSQLDKLNFKLREGDTFKTKTDMMQLELLIGEKDKEIENAKNQIELLKNQAKTDAEKAATEQQKSLKEQKHQYAQRINKQSDEIKKLKEEIKNTLETNKMLSEQLDNTNKMIYELSNKENDDSSILDKKGPAKLLESSSLENSVSQTSNNTSSASNYTPAKQFRTLDLNSMEKNGKASVDLDSTPPNLARKLLNQTTEPKTPSSAVKKANNCAQQ